MDKQIFKGKWNEFKGEMRKMWGDLTDDELEQTKGNIKAIGGLMQQKYGQWKDDARAKFDSITERYGDTAIAKTDEVKQAARDSVEKH